MAWRVEGNFVTSHEIFLSLNSSVFVWWGYLFPNCLFQFSSGLNGLWMSCVLQPNKFWLVQDSINSVCPFYPVADIAREREAYLKLAWSERNDGRTFFELDNLCQCKRRPRSLQLNDLSKFCMHTNFSKKGSGALWSVHKMSVLVYFHGNLTKTSFGPSDRIFDLWYGAKYSIRQLNIDTCSHQHQQLMKLLFQGIDSWFSRTANRLFKKQFKMHCLRTPAEGTNGECSLQDRQARTLSQRWWG